MEDIASEPDVRIKGTGIDKGDFALFSERIGRKVAAARGFPCFLLLEGLRQPLSRPPNFLHHLFFPIGSTVVGYNGERVSGLWLITLPTVTGHPKERISLFDLLL